MDTKGNKKAATGGEECRGRAVVALVPQPGPARNLRTNLADGRHTRSCGGNHADQSAHHCGAGGWIDE